MPSEDPRIRLALEALAQPIAEFRTFLGAALAQAESRLAAGADPGGRAAHARVELGPFAEGRIRPDGFVALTASGNSDAPALREALTRSIAVLRGALDRGPELILGEVPPGTDLAATAEALLAEVGRLFTAVRLVDLVRSDRSEPSEFAELPTPLPWARWSRTERRRIPPLVLALEGNDLHPGALAEYCDSHAKFLLVVRGPCAPAALARLITPGVLVLQTSDSTGLDRFVAYGGPAVAALVPEGAARFLHDPEAGQEPWQRIRMDALPELPRRAVGGTSAWQQAEDLRQLASLAKAPLLVSAPSANPPGTGPSDSDAVDRLAAWLLAQADAP